MLPFRGLPASARLAVASTRVWGYLWGRDHAARIKRLFINTLRKDIGGDGGIRTLGTSKPGTAV